MSDVDLTSALENQPTITGSISITDVKNLGMIDLRGELANKKFTAAIKKTLGCVLPAKSRTATNAKDVTALWLSPDQWLVTCPDHHTQKLLSVLNSELAGIHSHAVDVSHMRCVIRLEGNGVKEVLMKGSSVDLTLSECKKGFVRRLLFADQAALIHMVSQNPDCIELYVFRSYAEYVWKWLEVTAKPAAVVKLFSKQGHFEI